MIRLMNISSEDINKSTADRQVEAVVFDGIGLSFYIAWSFILWNGSALLSDSAPKVLDFAFNEAQGIFTVIGALVIVLGSRWIVSLRRRTVLLGVFALLSSASAVLVALGETSVGFGGLVLAFAVSGVGSTFRLGWEEWLSVRGVKQTALSAGIAYGLGFITFVVVSLFPKPLPLICGVVFPFVSVVLLRLAVRHGCTYPAELGEVAGQSRQSRLLGNLRHMPWKLLIVVALVFFAYGATRANGVSAAVLTDGAFAPALAAMPALGSCMAIFVGYLFYRKNAALSFYLAFPLMALACVLPVSWDPFNGGTAFWVALMGAEIVKYVVWFLLIDSIVKDGLSALLCVALLRVCQWSGSVAAQIAAQHMPSPEALAIFVLLALMAALLVITGVPAALERGGASPARLVETRSVAKASQCLTEVPPALPSEEVSDGAKENVPDAPYVSTLDRKVTVLAKQCSLSPREQEVCSIWLKGHTQAFVERELFISRSTVKTHLNHIYAKTGAANREQLLQLVDGIEL